jgi:lipid-binding SYLF domain-containing protein
MKTIILGMILLGFAGPALAIERSDLDNRIRLLTAKFDEMQANPQTAIPPGILQNAKGVILIDRTKAGFLFAFEGGGGVAMVRSPDTTTGWSPVSFMGGSEVSLGLQAGGEQGFYVIVVTDLDATHLLTGANYEYGSEARGTAGVASGGPRSELSPLRQQAVVFSDRKGLYGGVDLSAGGILPDDKANVIYYGRSITADDILFGNAVLPGDAAAALARQLNRGSKQADVSASLP